MIALALGEDKTRKELIPFLTQEIKQDKFCDEVKVFIAEVLGTFVEFVGGVTEAHCLFKPLVELCLFDESTVRDMAIDSINLIGKKLSRTQIATHLVPAVNELVNERWFTPRVAACGLLALACPSGASDYPKDVEAIIEKFSVLADDDDPMVRRAAALRISDLAEKLVEDTPGSSLVEKDLFELFTRFLTDSKEESVRVNALRSCARVCKLIKPDKKFKLLDKEFRGCVENVKSWRLRIACAEVIADVAVAAGDDERCIAILQDFYKTLQEDKEEAVKIATAQCAARFAKALLASECPRVDSSMPAVGNTFSKDVIFPSVKKLVLHEFAGETPSRPELTSVLMDLAAPMGKEASLRLLLPHIISLCNADDNLNVRLAVINSFEDYIGVVGLRDDQQGDEFLKLVLDLSKAKVWRIRHKILLLLPVLAKELGVEVFMKYFGESLSSFAGDSAALIRTDFCHVMCRVVEGGVNPDWLQMMIVPILLKAKDLKHYQMQAVFLDWVVLAKHLRQDIIETQLLQPTIKDFLFHEVPNMRIYAVRALIIAASRLKDSQVATRPIIEHLQDALGKEQQDTENVDRNVVEEIEKAIKEYTD
uniref:Uncharacterized protein n=1 Tax=Coccolithus braarudii TaxID=221442 RepID=A0A7S0LD39_9EUKA